MLVVHHQGWLIKSPPLEQAANQIIKARWRRRWFVLEEQNHIFCLRYYSDDRCKHVKGVINLDECEQVDIGLTVENGKQKYEFMFDIKTPGRVYYLAAESYEDMVEWVKKVCEACGLQASQDEDEQQLQRSRVLDAGFTTADLTRPSQPTSVSSESSTQSTSTSNTHSSNPYIHISTCFTGGRPNKSNSTSNNSPTKVSSVDTSPRANPLELSNYDIGDDSVFLPPSSPSSSAPLSGGSIPPRPPKPAHLNVKGSPAIPKTTGENSSNYANSEDMETAYKQLVNKNVLQPIPKNTVPPPRPSPSEKVPTSSAPPPPVVSRNLKPNRNLTSKSNTMGGLATRRGVQQPQQLQLYNTQQHFATMGHPRGGNSYTKVPPVQRALKPKNTDSSEASLSSMSPPPNSSSTTARPRRRGRPAPIQESKTLPRNYHASNYYTGPKSANAINNNFNKSVSQLGRYSWQDEEEEEEEEQIYFFLPPLASSDSKFPTMIPADVYEHSSIAYIDLDLPKGSSLTSTPNDVTAKRLKDPFSPDSVDSCLESSNSGTAYKRIDFTKTNALSETRNKVEEKYNKEQT